MIDTKSHDHKIIALAALMLVAFALVALLDGCAVHRQAPVRLIPYDFADRDFYDRSYAPSPSYAGARAGSENRTIVIKVNPGDTVVIDGETEDSSK